jgi:hypothetical protein
MFRRPLLLVVMLLLCGFVVGLLAVGAFPPDVSPQAVERTLPNERFGAR